MQMFLHYFLLAEVFLCLGLYAVIGSYRWQIQAGF